MKKSATPFQWNFTREELTWRAPSCGSLTQPWPCVTLIPNGNTKPQKRCHLIDTRRQKRVSMGGRVQKGLACVSMSGGD